MLVIDNHIYSESLISIQEHGAIPWRTRRCYRGQ